MTDFDDTMIADAGTFMDAFGKEALAVYTPKGRAPVEDIKVMYDPETLAFDPLTNGNVEVPAFITIETATLSEKVAQGDKFLFDGILVEVKQWEGELGGLTTLSIRVINNEQC